MNLIKTGTIQFTGMESKEKIASLSEKFENYLNKNYEIVAKFALKFRDNGALKKNLQILYYLKDK